MKSISVPQPQFSNWLIQRRQQLNLSNADLIRMTHGRISERTVKNLESGHRTSFRENTLIELALVLDLNYEQMLNCIDDMGWRATFRKKLTKLFNKRFLYPTIGSAILLFLVFISSTHSYSEPFKITTNPYGFQVLDAQNNTLFAKDYSINLKKAVISDINNDKEKEIIIGGHQVRKPNEDESVSGTVYCYNQLGTELWTYHPFDGFFYKGGGRTKRYGIGDLLYGHFLKQKSQEILISFGEIGWFESGLTLLDAFGNPISKYYNPGRIRKLVYNEETNLLLVYANNNHYKETPITNKYPSCVMLFDAANISGQAPPYRGKGAAQGSQLWYFSILPNGSKVSDLDFSDFNANGSLEIRLGVDDKCVYILDMSGKVLQKSYTDKYNGEKYSFVFH